MPFIEKYTVSGNIVFEEELKRYDGAMAIERFRGSMAEYREFKGGQVFRIINTGNPYKFIEGNSKTSVHEALADALATRQGKLIKLFGIFALRFGRYNVEEVLLSAYNLGATALIEYEADNKRSRGTPIQSL